MEPGRLLIDTFVVWIEGTGVTSASMKWILADRQGSVAVVTDNNGWAVQRFAYDPFGNETAGAPGTGFPFRYTGQRFDPETGLYYYKARYSSAKLGRFLQTDPIGYADNMNLYAYVGNDPINATDPSGMACEASRVSNTACLTNESDWKAYSEGKERNNPRRNGATTSSVGAVGYNGNGQSEDGLKERSGSGPATSLSQMANMLARGECPCSLTISTEKGDVTIKATRKPNSDEVQIVIDTPLNGRVVITGNVSSGPGRVTLSNVRMKAPGTFNPISVNSAPGTIVITDRPDGNLDVYIDGKLDISGPLGLGQYTAEQGTYLVTDD